jgi:hypothetical protein
VFDGWNGGTATFTDADGNTVGSFAVEGSSGSWTISVPVESCSEGYDCAGTCGGDATEDCNGTCNGNGFQDCNGNCTTYDYWIGDGWCDSILACDEFGCDGGDCDSDCAGTCGGDAVADCAGTCGGSATVDECGECGGDGSSCACDGEYLTVNMTDSWGDGWNGNNFCINDECATIESGSTGSYTFCVDLSASNDVTCGGGSYMGEVSWTLNAEDGSEVLAGGAPYAGCLGDCGVGGCMDTNSDNYNSDATYDDGSCSYPCLDNVVTMNMYDSWGDGWNGGIYTITDDNTGAVVATGGLATGAFELGTLCLPDGCYSITVGGGSFDSEITFDFASLVGVGVGTYVVSVGTGAGCLSGCTDTLAVN